MKSNYQILTIILGITSVFLSGIMSVAATGSGLTEARLDDWLKGYEEAWETLNADKAAVLFTENATYQDTPYSEPYLGRNGIHKYWSTVTSDQKDVDFTYEVLSVEKNTGIAQWHSEFKQKSTGSDIILDGIFVLEFSPDGLCQSLREWWHIQVIPAEGNAGSE